MRADDQTKIFLAQHSTEQAKTFFLCISAEVEYGPFFKMYFQQQLLARGAAAASAAAASSGFCGGIEAALHGIINEIRV